MELVTAVAGTTDSSGAATIYASPSQFGGKVWGVRYVPDPTTPMATGADITITEALTGEAIITITNIGTSAVSFYPRAAVCDVTGTALTYDGTHPVTDGIPINGQIKLVIAQGGNTKATGTFYFWVGP